jgi:hypothetical protein
MQPVREMRDPVGGAILVVEDIAVLDDDRVDRRTLGRSAGRCFLQRF